MAARLGNETSGEWIGLELREGVTRLEPVTLPELERAPVELVGPRLGLHRDHAGDGLPELGVVVLRRDLGLPNRVEVRVDDDDAENRVPILRAVELVAGPAEMLTVHHRLHRALRVLACGMLPLELLRARRQQDELGEIAVDDRQVRQLPPVERGRHVRAVGLEQRQSARHLNRFGNLSHGQFHRQGCLGIDVDDHRWDHRRLEAGQLRLHLVVARQQALLGEVARLVGHYGVNGLALDAGDGDGDAREDATAFVGDRSTDAAVDRLCCGNARECESDDENERGPDDATATDSLRSAGPKHNPPPPEIRQQASDRVPGGAEEGASGERRSRNRPQDAAARRQ